MSVTSTIELQLPDNITAAIATNYDFESISRIVERRLLALGWIAAISLAPTQITMVNSGEIVVAVDIDFRISKPDRTPESGAVTLRLRARNLEIAVHNLRTLAGDAVLRTASLTRRLLIDDLDLWDGAQ